MGPGFRGGEAGTLFAGARVDEAVPLAPLTTLRVGPVAPRVITCTSTEQVVTTLRQLDSEGCRPLLVLAGGSNLVIADTLADLTVVRLAAANISVDGNIVRAEAGAVWDDVVVAAIAAGLGGLECLSGIPGSAGATPVQNVGAYGAEVADTITRVRLLDRRSGVVRWAPRCRNVATTCSVLVQVMTRDATGPTRNVVSGANGTASSMRAPAKSVPTPPPFKPGFMGLDGSLTCYAAFVRHVHRLRGHRRRGSPGLQRGAVLAGPAGRLGR